MIGSNHILDLLQRVCPYSFLFLIVGFSGEVFSWNTVFSPSGIVSKQQTMKTSCI